MNKGCSRPGQIRMFATALFATALLTAIDLSTKWLVVELVMDPPRRIPVFPFFDLVLVFNRGISFGFFSGLGDLGPVILSVITAGIIGFLFIWLWRAMHLKETIGITMIIGGAIGNLIDRIHDGTVTDFINLYVDQYHWPVFNGADVFISIGAFLLLLAGFGNDHERSVGEKSGKKIPLFSRKTTGK